MKRESDSINSPLIFKPFGGPMVINARMVNHELDLPDGKWLFELGLFTLGYLETDKGNDIEVAKRVSGASIIHLVSSNANENVDNLPIRIFPDIIENDFLSISENFFNPFYNCHGLVFGDSEYWINPLKSRIENGRMVKSDPNIKILLDDEFEQVQQSEEWNLAIAKNDNDFIVHSVKKEGDKILSKYDAYQLIEHDFLEEVDDSRYGNVHYEFYKNKTFASIT